MDHATLYELQDTVLATVFQSDTSFYLTGGTCLNRYHIARRYSDDLALFTADNALFRDDLRTAVHGIRRTVESLEFVVDTRDFARIVIDNTLNLDFVNDRVYRHGRPEVRESGIRVDNIVNIAANKLCAVLGRDEPKDVLDLCTCILDDVVEPGVLLSVAAKKCLFETDELQFRLLSFPRNLFDTLAVIDRAYAREIADRLDEAVERLVEAA